MTVSTCWVRSGSSFQKSSCGSTVLLMRLCQNKMPRIVIIWSREWFCVLLPALPTNPLAFLLEVEKSVCGHFLNSSLLYREPQEVGIKQRWSNDQHSELQHGTRSKIHDTKENTGKLIEVVGQRYELYSIDPRTQCQMTLQTIVFHILVWHHNFGTEGV